MDYEYDYLVFIGRFQPPHKGHFQVIEKALKLSRRVIVLLGSSNSGRTLRNPFTYKERVQMLRAAPVVKNAVYEFDESRVITFGIDDHTYTDAEWIKQVQSVVAMLISGNTSEPQKIGLIGYAKDHTSYYLKLFPQWGSVNVEPKDNVIWASTNIRNELFAQHSLNLFKKSMMLPSVLDVMTKLIAPNGIETDWFLRLKDEYAWVQKHKAIWKGTPYPVTFNTVDAVVVQSGHVLLVKRGAMPGKGLWALPGGYINPDETLEQSMLRELKEETKIQCDDWTIQQCTRHSLTFADPHRSPRGRTITHAFLVKFPDKARLPKVKGSDDAEKAKWVPLADLRADNMFEDHYFIIKKMTAGL
jgi:bifunctional NMN adenylyltransferase/nudix hydrolase